MKKESNFLREARTRLRMTQGELASTLGIAKNYVYLIESGRKPLSDKVRLAVEKLASRQSPDAAAPDTETQGQGSHPDASPPVAASAHCPGCVTRDGEIAYLRGVVADQAATMRMMAAGICRFPTGAPASEPASKAG